MGESKHTPGPWSALPDYVHGPLVVDACQNIIADYTMWTGEHIPEAKGNANLIAAAPEMKDALLMLRDYVLDTVDGHSTANPDVRQQAREDLIALDRVLRKANGE